MLFAPDLDSTEAQFTIEERIYKIERDENAMLERLKNVNLQAQGVDNFLYSRLGPMGDLKADSAMSLGAIIDTKRTYVETKTILQGSPFILQQLCQGKPRAAQDINLQFAFTESIQISGSVRFCSSDFTRMPKGHLSFRVFDHSKFVTELESARPEEPLTVPCEGLVLRVTKVVDREGEELTYRLVEKDFSQRIEFMTGFFDDLIKIQVYKDNTTTKSNLIGKATIHLRDLEFNTAMMKSAEPSIYPLTILSRKG